MFSAVLSIPVGFALSSAPNVPLHVIALIITLIGSYLFPIALWRWRANR
jgi:hypothetical protein